MNIKFILPLLCLLSPTISWALDSDREQPIHIESDKAQIRDNDGIAKYIGNAVLTQGTLRINGDIITFYYDANKELTKITAEGELATYQQTHKPGESDVQAKAELMEYYAGNQTMILVGQGHIQQDGDKFSGDRIEYDINKNIVNARSDSAQGSDNRIHVIIQPPGKKSTPPPVQDKTPVPPLAVENQEQNKSGIVTARLNIRTEPDVNANKLGTIPPHNSVTVLAEQGEWLQVKTSLNGQVTIGWVNRIFVKLSN